MVTTVKLILLVSYIVLLTNKFSPVFFLILDTDYINYIFFFIRSQILLLLPHVKAIHLVEVVAVEVVTVEVVTVEEVAALLEMMMVTVERVFSSLC